MNALGTGRGGNAIPRCVPRHLGMTEVLGYILPTCGKTHTKVNVL